MKADLLVATPQASFGELIRQSLSDTGSFRVHMANGKAEAILAVEKANCSLALLDMELGHKELLEIGRSLRSLNPDLDLVILADEELPPAMDAIRPWVLLRKPFYLPDFVQLIRAVPIIPDQLIDVLEKDEEPVSAEMKPFPQDAPQVTDIPWLNDVSKAAQHLTRLTLESSAQAALITREKDLWAYAGQLSQNAANELAGTVSRHWDGQKGNDLLRFVRLESTKAEHMLYATSMTSDVILALVFDAETPFSTIRSQANSLARSLAIAKTGPLQSLERVPAPKREQVQVESEADEVDESSEDLAIPSIADILNEIPPPVPPERVTMDVPQMSAADDNKSVSTPDFDVDPDPSAAATRPSTPLQKNSARRLSQESSPAIHLRDLMLADQPGHRQDSLTDFADELAATLPSKSQRRRPATPIRQPAPGELDETRPHSITEVAGRMITESASPGMAQLNYACLLVPRFTAHYMTGDLADRLSEWMPNICIAFGWRLEFLAVRPEYLQWVLNVTPNTSPGYLMRIMRQQTSEKIFGEFPRLKRDNPSGDFWAPGYLIMGGLQPHPPQLVKDYIKQTRQRQGISQPRR